MKGAIAQCLGDLVKEKFGKDKWEEALEKAGLFKGTSFTPIQNVDDAKVLELVQEVCKVLKITLNQAADAFGDYWVNVYAARVYGMHYKKAKNSKEFLQNMDNVHDFTTRSIPDAHPPRFTYEWPNDNTMIMHYKSDRGLIDFLVGLIKGVGRYYNENLKVTKLSSNKVQVIF